MSGIINESNFNQEWVDVLKEEEKKLYFINLFNFLKNQVNNKISILPSFKNVFNAYKLPLSKVKVCIIGQDPYPTAGQAHGLSFSVLSGNTPASLRRIKQALISDLNEIDKSLAFKTDLNWEDNLQRWNDQGIMLLNRILTVEEGKPNSHKNKGWEEFTNKTIEILDGKKDVVFLLWGKEAMSLIHLIKNSKVLTAEHPVAGAYQGRPWNNENCFKELHKSLKEEIEW